MTNSQKYIYLSKKNIFISAVSLTGFSLLVSQLAYDLVYLNDSDSIAKTLSFPFALIALISIIASAIFCFFYHKVKRFDLLILPKTLAYRSGIISLTLVILSLIYATGLLFYYSYLGH